MSLQFHYNTMIIEFVGNFPRSSFEQRGEFSCATILAVRNMYRAVSQLSLFSHYSFVCRREYLNRKKRSVVITFTTVVLSLIERMPRDYPWKLYVSPESAPCFSRRNFSRFRLIVPSHSDVFPSDTMYRERNARRSAKIYRAPRSSPKRSGSSDLFSSIAN